MHASVQNMSLQQGQTAFITYRVQRSYGYGWDIEADHFDVPAFRKISCCDLLKPLLPPFLYVVGAEHRVCTHVSPHEPASSDAADGCYMLRNHWQSSCFHCWFVARLSAHTHTRQRDVKQVPLSELFESVCVCVCLFVCVIFVVSIFSPTFLGRKNRDFFLHTLVRQIRVPCKTVCWI